eukprot:2446140-Pyramimonas_sp.AAC.1
MKDITPQPLFTPLPRQYHHPVPLGNVVAAAVPADVDGGVTAGVLPSSDPPRRALGSEMDCARRDDSHHAIQSVNRSMQRAGVHEHWAVFSFECSHA